MVNVMKLLEDSCDFGFWYTSFFVIHCIFRQQVTYAETLSCIASPPSLLTARAPRKVPGSHVFRIVALNFDGSPASESTSLMLTFDGKSNPTADIGEGAPEPTTALL